MTVTQTLDGKLKKDMAYADLRKLLLTEGWTPLADPGCKDNVGGEALICDKVPELETCSGDGHCAMNFQNTATAARLRVTTYGEYSDWNVPGPESRLAVTGWDFSGADQQASNASMPMPAEGCTLEGHAAFLESFARDDKVRNAYTAPQLQMRDIKNPDAPPRLIGKDTYDQFRIDLADYRWVYRDAARDENSYEHLDVKQKRTGNQLRVDYVKAEFDSEDDLVRTYGKPGAYLFEFTNGCWHLTQDLQ